MSQVSLKMPKPTDIEAKALEEYEPSQLSLFAIATFNGLSVALAFRRKQFFAFPKSSWDYTKMYTVLGGGILVPSNIYAACYPYFSMKNDIISGNFEKTFPDGELKNYYLSKYRAT